MTTTLAPLDLTPILEMDADHETVLDAVHSALIKHPVTNDALYGDAGDDLAIAVDDLIHFSPDRSELLVRAEALRAAAAQHGLTVVIP